MFSSNLRLFNFNFSILETSFLFIVSIKRIFCSKASLAFIKELDSLFKLVISLAIKAISIFLSSPFRFKYLLAISLCRRSGSKDKDNRQ